ncbi:MAG: inositol monophosphatase [Alphaproteobacteria bacterium]|nr:inositol monophosphatase [Alphaproteobacteria bacterium]
MSYVSPLLTAFVNAVKKSASSLDRDFCELEQLQNSIKGNKNFVFNSYSRIEKNLKIELAKIRADLPIFTPSDKVSGSSYFAVSPIDGIANFAHGNPNFAVCAALVENDVIICSVVYNPSRDETFFAEKGKGAYKEGYRNHERLRVSATKELNGALISSSVDSENIVNSTKILTSISAKTGDLRVSGSIGQDLAYLAGGKLDAFICLNSHISSMAAGMLLVKEAGGSVRAIEQKDIRVEDIKQIFASQNLVASNFNLNQKVFEIFK